MSFIRTFAERASRNRSFKRSLPSGFGGAAVLVSPDSQLKYLKPGAAGFDAVLLERAKEFVRPGMKVWDIGANVGVFAAAAAGLGAHVIAIEPDPWLASLLRETARLKQNASFTIVVLCTAVSDSNGVTDLMIAARGRASNAIAIAKGNENMGGVRETLSVPTLTLDTLLDHFGAPNFIKIDVEGAEMLALNGATRLLGDVRPVWMIEVNKSNMSPAAQIFQAYQYHLFDADLPKEARLEISACSFNTLALPRDSNGGQRLQPRSQLDVSDIREEAAR